MYAMRWQGWIVLVGVWGAVGLLALQAAAHVRRGQLEGCITVVSASLFLHLCSCPHVPASMFLLAGALWAHVASWPPQSTPRAYSPEHGTYSFSRRNRTTARKSWARLLDAVLLQQPAAGQQPAEQGGQLEAAAGSEGEATPAAAAAAGAPSDPSTAPATEAGEQAGAAGQGQLTGWLRRLSSGALGSRSASTSASAAAAAAAVREVDAGSEAGSEASSQRASAGPSPLRAASLVASSSHRRGLSAALEDLPALSPGGEDAPGTAGAAGAAAAAGAAQQAQRGTARAPSPGLRPPRPPSAGASPRPSVPSPGSGLAAAVGLAHPSPSHSPAQNAQGPTRAASPLLSRVQLLRDTSLQPGVPLMLFPDTEEGHLAQASWSE